MRMLWREVVVEVKSQKLLNHVRSAALEFDLRLPRPIVIVKQIDLVRQRIDLRRERQRIDLMLSACEINVRNRTGTQNNRTLDLKHL